MTPRAHHVQDERLFECYVAERCGDRLDPGSVEHLAGCDRCRERYAELVRFMATVRADAHAEADEVFTPERLRAQQEHIARRVAHLGQPARIIVFPGGPVGPQAASTIRPARRWIAAAAAAGLFVGVAVGAFFDWQSHDAPLGSTVKASGQTPAPRQAHIGVRPLRHAGATDEDLFLSDLETASERPHTRELMELDALTPHVREVGTTLR